MAGRQGPIQTREFTQHCVDEVSRDRPLPAQDVHPSVLSPSKGRMPVILARTDWSDWLGVAEGAQRHRAPDAAGLLCRPYPELMVVERTAERWVKR